MKPFSESCEQNQKAILAVLQEYFLSRSTALEIGSGTGQHAVFFAKQLPNLLWMTSDQAEYHAGIKLWLADAGLKNIQEPLLLDVNQIEWPLEKTQAIFSANTVHIMSWSSVINMFTGIARVLEVGGIFCLYGPFNYNGEFTSESNAHFDVWLKQRNLESGVRDFEALQVLAEKAGLTLMNDHEMPANNRTLVWEKTKA